MESWLPVILFVLGFVAAVSAGGLFKWNIRVRGVKKLPVDHGAIRLDRLGKGATVGQQRPESQGEVNVRPKAVSPAPAKVAANEKRRGEDARSGKRK